MALCTCKNSSALYSETLNRPSRDTAVRSSGVRKSTGAVLSMAPSLSLKCSIARCKSFALGSAKKRHGLEDRADSILHADGFGGQDEVIIFLAQFRDQRRFQFAELLRVQRLRDLIVGEQRADALHLLGIGELAILGDGADLREDFQDPMVKEPDEHFERFVALLAPHVTLVLVLAKCAVVEGLQAGQEDIDQVVVQPIVLMRDKGYE